MKRAVSMLGALALAAGFFLFGAPAANAQTVFCTNITQTGNTNYPYDGSAQHCGVADGSHASGMAGELWDLSLREPSLYSKMAADHAKFYIFNTGAEYESYMTAHGIAHTNVSSIPNGTVGWTYKNGTTQPLYTVLFVYAVGFTPPNGYMDNLVGTVGFVTAHEAGHWADYYYNGLVNGTSLASASSMFNDLLARDWINVNPLVNCGIGGIFNGSQDQGTPLGGAPVWVCSGQSHNQLPLNSRYTGSNNQTVLQVGWFYIFSQNFELLPDLVANDLGQTDKSPQGAIKFFGGNKFSCTKYLIHKLVHDGILPTKSQLAGVAKEGGGAGSAMCPQTGTGWPPLNP